MIPSLRHNLGRAGIAALRPRAVLLLRTAAVSCSFDKSSIRVGTYGSLKRRYASTASALAGKPVDSSSATTENDEDMGDDEPLFASLEGKIHTKTLNALTNGPFQYTHMSQVQAEVLPLLPDLVYPRVDNPSSRDLLVKARTGTGKTIGFLVPAVESRLRELEQIGHGEGPRVIEEYAKGNVGTLIISPTRELAQQIEAEAVKLSKVHGFHTQVFVGGLDKRRQVTSFKYGRKDILVATPGRLRDMLQDKSTGVANALKRTGTVILDEADTLLDMGFRADIEDILSYLPAKDQRQTFLFSATVSEGIKQIANKHLRENHAFINCVSSDASPVHAHIPQYHTVVTNYKDQLPHILRLIFQDQLEHKEKSKVILFTPTTKMTQLMAGIVFDLCRPCLPAWTEVHQLHSKRDQKQRMITAAKFRQTTNASVLVTSDVSARGVDYPGVTRVIQLGLPSSPEQYVHRVGRTGRGGSRIGRGDLVLLPFEYEYIRRNLSHIPLKPLTTTDLASECNQTITEQKASSKTRVRFDDLERTISEYLPQLDGSQVEETVMSLLGCYASNTSSMHTSIDKIMVALQEWSVEGLGLSTPPYISQSFLKKLGGGKPEKTARPREQQARSFGQKREWRDDRVGGRRPFSKEFGGYRPRDDGNGSDYYSARRSASRESRDRDQGDESYPYRRERNAHVGRRTRSYENRQQNDW